jgi:hypothetical protein
MRRAPVWREPFAESSAFQNVSGNGAHPSFVDLPQNLINTAASARLSRNFGDEMNVIATPPALTQDGMLYVGFGDPYDALYALNVGVGLATNSPWPTPAGDPRLTRRVAHRPLVGTGEENRN